VPDGACDHEIVKWPGRDVVEVLAVEEYERVLRGSRDFKELLMRAPDLDALDIRRDSTPVRIIDLPAIETAPDR
jgi:hypothetical protein